MAEIDSILDNQVVTAQILNDIAKDLGLTSFNGFGEDDKFGADELNGITSALVSKGILSSDNQCAPYISEDEDKAWINTGTIVFGNGAKKKITEPVELDLIANTYIYALNDTTNNVCKIIVSETAPTDDVDFVNLAEISSDKTLIDKRTIAKATVAFPAEGNSFSFTESYAYKADINTLHGKTITIPIKGVSKIFVVAKGASFGVLNLKANSPSFSGVYIGYDSDSIKTQEGANSLCLDYRHTGTPYYAISLSIESITEESVVLKYNVTTDLTYVYDDLTVKFYVFGGIEK